jgi:hypothetical protein
MGKAARNTKMMINGKAPKKCLGYARSNKINPGVRKSFSKYRDSRRRKDEISHAKISSDEQNPFHLFLVKVKLLFF